MNEFYRMYKLVQDLIKRIDELEKRIEDIEQTLQEELFRREYDLS